MKARGVSGRGHLAGLILDLLKASEGMPRQEGRQRPSNPISNVVIVAASIPLAVAIADRLFVDEYLRYRCKFLGIISVGDQGAAIADAVVCNTKSTAGRIAMANASPATFFCNAETCIKQTNER